MPDTNQIPDKAIPDYIKEAAEIIYSYNTPQWVAFITGAMSPASARYHQSDFQIAWELSKGRDKPFFIDTFRKLLNQFDREEISMSKIVEELNVAAYKWRYHQSPVAVELLRLYFDLMKKAETEQHFDHLLQEHDWNNKAKNCIASHAHRDENKLTEAIILFESLLSDETNDYEHGEQEAYKNVIDTLKKMLIAPPPASPVAERDERPVWVKASERLPGKGENVFARVNGMMAIGYYSKERNCFTSGNHNYLLNIVEWLSETPSEPDSIRVKGDAVEFAEWIEDNSYARIHSKELNKSAWVNCEEHDVMANGSDYHFTVLINQVGKTTEQLYNLYKSQK